MKVEAASVALFPAATDAPPGSVVVRLDDGARAVCTVAEHGELTVVKYLHGPATRSELARLGLADVKTVRVRAVADPFWSTGPEPPELTAVPAQIAVELRGRLGTIVSVGSAYKYDVTAQVRLHRARPGEARQTLTLPLIWLEPADV